MIRDLLQVKGYETIETVDGRQGVALAKEHHPKLILMDIQMPVMDGIQAAKILKADQETKGIPIIALTAYAMKGDEEKMREAGCEGYIAKPIDTRRFLKKVADYFSGEPLSTEFLSRNGK